VAQIDSLKRSVNSTIDQRRDEILRIGRSILQSPETGFKETKTAQLVARAFGELGLATRTELALTGVKAVAQSRNPGPTVALLGEMDALINYEHPFCEPQTGAAHCCGHNAQVAAMLGAAMGLIDSGALEHLSGNVAFMAVPAEEFIELDFRLSLKRQGKIEFLGGKQELIRLGEFDDVHMALITHSAPVEGDIKLGIGGRGLAFVAKQIQYAGKTAHAALTPHEAINALNAALIGLLAIHAQRETFREQDYVRVHPIITRGGDVVNAVPDNVTIETYVRAAGTESLLDANHKVDRALQAGALAIGAELRVDNVPGYLPITQHPDLVSLLLSNACELVGEDHCQDLSTTVESVSGDIGDVGHLMPAALLFSRGWKGHAHTAGYTVEDEEAAYILPAKTLAMTVVDLLWNGAERASRLLDGFKAPMTKQDYLAFLRGLSQETVFRAE
jgi:amidohydrolase